MPFAASMETALSDGDIFWSCGAAKGVASAKARRARPSVLSMEMLELKNLNQHRKAYFRKVKLILADALAACIHSISLGFQTILN